MQRETLISFELISVSLFFPPGTWRHRQNGSGFAVG